MELTLSLEMEQAHLSHHLYLGTYRPTKKTPKVCGGMYI